MTIPMGSDVFRDYQVSGVPGSGPNQPDKSQIRALLSFYETMLGAGAAGLAFATLAALNADLAHAANATAIVYGDGVAANNGLYLKSGASGSGSWARIGDLPNSIVRLTVTGGTANAIVATAPETPNVPGSKLYLLTPTSNNTGATTIAVNGGAAVAIKTALGSDLVTGSLLNNSQVLMAWSVDHYQLLLSVPVDATGVLNDTLTARDAASASATSAAASAAAASLAVAGFKIGFNSPLNLGLAASVASSALTISIKDVTGANPSTSSPVAMPFRSATIGTGTPDVIALTAATSLVISSGSTLGTTNSAPFRLWIVAFNDAGTVRLAAVRAMLPTGIFALNEWTLASSTAEGGAGAADSAGVFYTGTAVSSKAYRILGFMDWESGLAAAGTWSSGPTRIQLFGPGVPLPGAALKSVSTSRNTQDSFTATSYTPTNITAQITPDSACDLVGIFVNAPSVVSVSGLLGSFIIQRGGANVGNGVSLFAATANQPGDITLFAIDRPGSTSQLTYAVAARAASGQTIICPATGSAEIGGTMILEEIMG